MVITFFILFLFFTIFSISPRIFYRSAARGRKTEDELSHTQKELFKAETGREIFCTTFLFNMAN